MGDRPFIYEVAPTAVTRTFTTMSVTAFQPSTPSSNPQLDYFPIQDASLPPGPTSFAAMCSFKASEAHSKGVSIQEPPPQIRFASILESRPPQNWPPSPILDIDGYMDLDGADQVGQFPVVDMKKVDMRTFNQDKPVHQRVELLLYRLLRPLPEDGTDGYDANAHVVAHAFTADRNGLGAAGNHLGFGYSLGRVASLSYSFVVHVNADEAVIRENEWWIQEMTFPRAGAGRVIVESKIWSPDGVHVATEYQDGLCRGFEERKRERL
jgi:acyl-CoA thioesterase